MSELKITSLSELREYSTAPIVQLPDFAENRPFVARLSRPSIMDLAAQGKIPNSLLGTANDLFMGRSPSASKKQQDTLVDLRKLLDVFCEACFVEPTYEQLKDAGVALTDEQLMFVFNYAQRGVKALEPFRKEQ